MEEVYFQQAQLPPQPHTEKLNAILVCTSQLRFYPSRAFLLEDFGEWTPQELPSNMAKSSSRADLIPECVVPCYKDIKICLVF